jgi:hypothetical protein
MKQTVTEKEDKRTVLAETDVVVLDGGPVGIGTAN